MTTGLDDERAIAATTRVALEGVREQSTAARDLLALCSFLAPDEIPRQMLILGSRALSVEVQAPVRSAAALMEPVEILSNYELIWVRGDSFSVHRTLQAVMRSGISADERERWATLAAHIALAAFPDRPDDQAHWGWAARVLPHLRMTADHLDDLRTQPELAVRLRDREAVYLTARGQLDAARKLLEGALDRVVEMYPDGELHGTVLNNLATVERQLGRFNRAKRDANRALAIHRALHEAPGQEHRRLPEASTSTTTKTREAAEAGLPTAPEIADDLQNLGLTAKDQGNMAEALDYLQQSLKMRLELHGEDDVRVSEAYEALFGALAEAGMREDAALALKHATETEERVRGPNSDKAILNRQILTLLSEPDAPAESAARILSQSEAMFGLQHPWTADACVLAATLLRQLEMLDEARSMANRALDIYRRSYGEGHFRVGEALVDLMCIEAAAGNRGAAEERLRDAIEIVLAAAPEERATTLRMLHLDNALTSMAVADATRPLLAVVYAMLEQAVGDDEPAHLVVVEAALRAELIAGDVLLTADRYDESVPHYEEGLRLATRTVENPLDDAEFHMRLGVVSALVGDGPATMKHFGESITCMAASGFNAPVWVLVAECGRLYAALGRPSALQSAAATLIDDAMEGGTVPEFRATLTAAVPEGWFVKESTSLLAPDGEANVIASGEPLDPGIDTKHYAEVQGDLLRKEFPGYEERAFELTTIFGQREGYIREFEWTPPDGKRVTQMQLYYAADGHGYTATATAPTEGFPERELLLRETLRSLRILD